MQASPKTFTKRLFQSETIKKFLKGKNDCFYPSCGFGFHRLLFSAEGGGGGRGGLRLLLLRPKK